MYGANVAFCWMNTTDAGTGVTWSRPHGGATMAHEIGQNQGRRHVDRGGPDDPAAFDGPRVSFGGTLRVIRPTEAGDLMSYRRPRWLVDYTDRGLFNEQPSVNSRPTVSPRAEALAQAEEVLVATGSVGPSTGAAVPDTVYRLPRGTIAASKPARATAGPAVTTTEATSRPRLLDSAGTVLVEQSFHDRPNRGATRQVLALDHLSRTLTVDTQTRPGSQGQALVRVIAHDGVNTAIDQSDQPFTIRSTGGR